jgi:glycosyltransferase involved in cell wall biosynthesis
MSEPAAAWLIAGTVEVRVESDELCAVILFGPVFDRSATAAASSRSADFSLDQYDDSVRGRAFLALLTRVEDWAIRRSRAVITLTEAFGAELVRRLKIAAPHVIPSGHDVSGPAHDRERLRRQLDLPAGRWIALYAGLSFGGKSPAFLLEVADHLPDGVAIVIVGGTPAEHAELRDQAARRGSPRVDIRPRVTHDEAVAYIRAADIGLLVYPEHPSLGVHASPLKAVEYLAAGVPVVATDSPAARELVRDGENGWLVPRDPRQIARCLAAAAADPAAHARMRDAARRSVADRS